MASASAKLVRLEPDATDKKGVFGLEGWYRYGDSNPGPVAEKRRDDVHTGGGKKQDKDEGDEVAHLTRIADGQAILH